MRKYDFEKPDTKRPEDKIKHRRNVFLSLSMFIVTILLVLMLLSTDIFDIKKISVFGNAKVSYNEIVRLSGVTVGQNIFEVNRRQLKNRLENNPYLIVKEIKRRLPSELAIYVSERQGALIIEMSDGYELIDKEGICLEHIYNKDRMSLPMAIGINDAMFKDGENVTKQSQKGQMLMDLYNALDKYDFLSNVSTLDIRDEYDIIVTTNWGLQVKMGDSQNFESKMKWVQAVLKDMASKGQSKPKGILSVAYSNQAVYTPPSK